MKIERQRRVRDGGDGGDLRLGETEGLRFEIGLRRRQVDRSRVGSKMLEEMDAQVSSWI